MKILAIDTSTMISSISILEDEYILGEYSLNQQRTHSELLLPMIDDLSTKLGLEIKDFDVFAVGKGPGSFTGLRIGMSAIKTMAQVLDKKIIGVSTLEALAHGVFTDKYIMPLIDARGKRFFAAIYKWQGDKLVCVKEEGLFKLNDIKEFLLNRQEEFVLVGDAINLVKNDFEDIDGISYAHAALNDCIASNIALIAKKKALNNEFDSYYDLAPNYIRKSQAELDFDKRNSKGDK